MNKGIEKIDLCSECFKNKAEYLFYKISFGSWKLRTFCKECAKIQSEKEQLGVV